MKRVLYSFLLIIFLFCLNLNAQEYYWIFEDRNANGEWEFLNQWRNGGDDIETVLPWSNIPLSLTNYSGTYSLKLHFNHLRANGRSAGCSITTSTDGTGRHPINDTDKNKGKDISTMDAFQFYVKATNASGINTVGIKIGDSSGKETDKILLKDYISLTDTQWHYVRIPLVDFSWRNGIDKTIITKVNFQIEQYDPSGEWALLVDNAKFTNANLSVNSNFKCIYEADGDVDLVWEYSGVSTNTNGGLNIETVGGTGNLPVSTNQQYKGNTSLKIHVTKHNVDGWGYMWISCNSNGYGVPPSNPSARKDISSYSGLRFYIKGETNTLGRMEIGDTDGNSTKKIELTDHVWVTNGWQEVIIPFSDIDWTNCDRTRFKEIKFIIEPDHAIGEFTCYIDNLEFITTTTEPGYQPPKVSEVEANAVGNNNIRISWKNVPFEDRYYLYRNTVNTPPGSYYAVLNDEVTSYLDTSCLGGATYYYWVRAENTHGGGLSVISDSVSNSAGLDVNWIFEDSNNNGAWEHSESYTGGADTIGTIGAWNNIPTSSTSHSGNESLKLRFNHTAGSWCCGLIPTSSDGSGYDPKNNTDKNIGKDISGADTMELWVKASNASGINSCYIELKDVNGNASSKIILKDYITLTNTRWNQVQIPLNDFIWPDGFNKSQLTIVNFLAQQYDPTGDWLLYIDDLKFINLGINIEPSFKFIFEDIGDLDLKWDFSGAQTNEGVVFERSPDGDRNVPVSTNEYYMGNTSLMIHVRKDIANGYGSLWVTGRKDGSGLPPESWGDDYDHPKDVSFYKYFSFWIKGSNTTIGKMEFKDTDGGTSGGIQIQSVVSVSTTWKQVKIPVKDIGWVNGNPRRIKNLQFIIDSAHLIGGMSTGEYTCYIDNMEFTGLGEGIFKSHDYASNLQAVYMGDHVMVTWTPVAYSYSSYITGYKIYYSFNQEGTKGKNLQPGDSPIYVSGGLTGSLKITGFQPKDIIYFAISSIDEHGLESTRSEFVKVICLKDRKLGIYPNYIKSDVNKTEIWFNSKKADNVKIKIYSLTGQLVWKKKVFADIGLNKVEWYKENIDKQAVSSGIYIVHVEGGGINETSRCILIK